MRKTTEVLTCVDCEAPRVYARGRCNPCYARHKAQLKKAGKYTPLRTYGSTEERLLADAVPAWGGCILRTSGIDRDGYSLIREGSGKTRRAHRVAYELLVGPIPSGLHLDHLCHTEDASCPGGPACLHRRCINPRHLDPVTNAENAARSVNARKTHCTNGHEFTAANTRIDRGHRVCRACDRESSLRYKARRRATT
ncbi:HNH endonuclease signature motif containing protein [Streptomyces anulatus]